MTLIVPIKDWPATGATRFTDALWAFENTIPKWALPYWVDLTVHGISSSALQLAGEVKPQRLAQLCWAIGQSMEPPLTQEAFSALLRATWMHAHNHLLAHVRHIKLDRCGLPESPAEWLDFELAVLRDVAELFGAADCPKLPAELQEVAKKADSILVYRGTFGLGAKEAAQGLSWSISKSKAEWFALRGPYGLDVYPRREFRHEHGPLVTTAAIDVNDVLMWSNERGEQEVVAYVEPWQVVACEAAEERVAFFDTWEEWEESRRDPLLLDKAIQADA